MCFKSKVKQPKVSDQQAAPQPVLLEAPKGAEYGDGADDSTDTPAPETGLKSLKVEKDSPRIGEGSQTATAKDTGAVKKPSPAVKRAMKRT